MNDHFLTDIEIEQFKCFTDFKASGFKRVNLIGGKNNIGKTAFMEACFINVHATTVNAMITAIIIIKFRREILNVVDSTVSEHRDYLDAIKIFKNSSNINNISYEIIEKNAIKKYQFNINKKPITIDNKDLTFTHKLIDNINFIDNFGWPNRAVCRAYQSIQKHDQEDELNSFIHEFDNNIDNFKVIDGKPQCKTNGEYRDIVEFGDGLRHYISIICALYACENGYLFIDEIDNGIHYSQLDKLWELILTLSKKTNCQLFAITHSKEMLESFARVAKKLNDQDISYTTLVKNKQQEIMAITRDYEMLLDSIEQEREVRGW
ncbi:ATP/GTP-binding protein [Crenothrix sp.]|uniref:AAA family ATPase n=1 Tax=Crenothrix sp. TaxID=3100433 RepID=UPI00374CA730